MSATRAGVQSCIFHMAMLQPIQVNKLQCECGAVMLYDGIEAAILNLDKVELFTHEVLKW